MGFSYGFGSRCSLLVLFYPNDDPNDDDDDDQISPNCWDDWVLHPFGSENRDDLPILQNMVLNISPELGMGQN